MNDHSVTFVSAKGPPWTAGCVCGWRQEFDEWLDACDASVAHAFDEEARKVQISARPLDTTR